MAIYNEWLDLVENLTEDQSDYFNKEYYEKEEALYKVVLGMYPNALEGRFDKLCDEYNFEPVMFCGFIDGINTSLKTPYDMKKIRINSKLKFELDYEKLYFNMLEAKARWLYELPEWDNILTPEKRRAIVRERNESKRAVSNKIDRNAPCPCGSGKKYKKCCGANA
ncbi:MAG: SEC-C domain-containing protein [Clostridiales bacterium]|nr:SEC-C domain-containing protein [Clostridiales bacterium]